MIVEILQVFGFDVCKLPEVYRENNISIRHIGDDVIHLIIDYSDDYVSIRFKISKIYNIYYVNYEFIEFEKGFEMTRDVFEKVTDDVGKIKQLIIIKEVGPGIYSTLNELEGKVPEAKSFNINDLDKAIIDYL